MGNLSNAIKGFLRLKGLGEHERQLFHSGDAVRFVESGDRI